MTQKLEADPGAFDVNAYADEAVAREAISAVATAPELLPRPAGGIGQLPPPGAGASLLRSTGYFDGAAAGGHIAVLAGSWLSSSRAWLEFPLSGADRPSRMKRCEEKIRYRTAAAARWRLWGIWVDRYLGGRRHRRERRAYACPHCNGWHLTSQPKRRRPTTR